MTKSEKLMRNALAAYKNAAGIDAVVNKICELEKACNPAAITAMLAELDQLRTRVFEADLAMLLLTADHNSTPNYVKGFQAASEYFSKYDEIVAQQVAA